MGWLDAALFEAESIVICYANVEDAKRWWVATFACQPLDVPEYWDCVLPSDVALTLPWFDEPTILLSSRAEIERANMELPRDPPILFCKKLKKAQEYLTSRGAACGPILDGRDTEYFEIRDPEDNVIEICREPGS